MKRKNGEEKEDVGGKRRTNVFVMKVMEKKKLKMVMFYVPSYGQDVANTGPLGRHVIMSKML